MHVGGKVHKKGLDPLALSVRRAERVGCSGDDEDVERSSESTDCLGRFD